MRFLLTADLHLDGADMRRNEALARIVDTAEERAVDAICVAGDLFDENVAVESAIPTVRREFSRASADVYVIPGNHDRTAFRGEDYFGEGVSVLGRPPVDVCDLGDIVLLGVPYTEEPFDQLLDPIVDAARPEATNVLLLHGTLIGPEGTIFGDEGAYLPVTPEQLVQTGCQYVFAGHIHARPTHRQIDDELVFLYPGSPVSITRSEVGPRGVWIVDTDADTIRESGLDTAHYERITLRFTPGREAESFETLHRRVGEVDHEHAILEVRASGFVAEPVDAVIDRIESIVDDVGASSPRIDAADVRDVTVVVESDLYQAFREELNARDVDDAEAIETIALEAFARHARG